MNEIIKSRGFKVAAVVVGVFILMLGSFAAGVSVGFRKVRFSNDFGKNYERNFMGAGRGQGLPGQGMMSGLGSQNGKRFGMMGGQGLMGGRGGMMSGLVDQFEGRGFRNAYGLAGIILSITDNNIIVKDRDNKENTVAVSDKTLIKNGREDWKITDLKTGDNIVVMGSPNESGVIDATLIRVFVSV